jgi:hypothetical protein
MRPALLLLLALTACNAAPEAKAPESQGQTFPQAVEMMCNVDRLAGLDSAAEPLEIGQKRSAWINEHVDNPDAIELRTRMSVKPASEQAEMLREKSTSCSLGACPFADALEKDGMGGLSP